MYLTTDQVEAIARIAKERGDIDLREFGEDAEPIKEVRVYKHDRVDWLHDSYIIHPDGEVEGPTEVKT